jgi:hypothetical protein
MKLRFKVDAVKQAYMVDDISEQDLCAIGTKVAMMGGMSVCSPDQLEQRTQDLLGVPNEVNPPCEEMFDDGFTEPACTTFPNPQVMAFCMVHNEPPLDEFGESLLDVHDGDLSEAVTHAWEIVGENCNEYE